MGPITRTRVLDLKRPSKFLEQFQYLKLMEEAPELEATSEDVTELMAEILERLRLLNYEKDFLSKGSKPLNPAYFAIQANPAEQFNYFKNLVKYLLQLCEVKGNDFSQYDDPMTVSTNIINECKKIGIACQYPPLKLKSGSGEQVVLLLSQLTAKALKKVGFAFKQPQFDQVKGQQVGKEQQGGQQEMQEEVEEAGILEEELEQGEHHIQINQDKQVIVSNVPEKDWLLECERVANKLKVTAKPDSKEWRSHVQSTRTCGQSIRKSIPESRNKLERLSDQITKTLDKISKSEKVINSNMSDVGLQYRQKSEESRLLNTQYTNLTSSIKEMNESHREISEKLQMLLAKTNQHSGTMSDSSPVVKVKSAIQKMASELKTMDVRIGVLNHSVLEYRVKEKRAEQRGAPRGVDMPIIDELEND